ncbi:hypothetical protein EMIHUDRAFT_219621 [Emiliania huxleyi CCMP1516]|uniref:Uncharacterized protein n=2 Tax=Emiliania huxleyi TaxID=2903 RepID=A0A0D3I3T9_EMIH1|nr:hypothetical protein EMIHUDRAFT_219621 [Emiliania huxleyi CCMP1516]EOD05924.1 hypothetical protein EMIHUDRAFT_219621 [Emiliania huxleyi CCMP1516]|eukprot:XP_005758353.1 hypothetical protein EMIHUDRAFT_219621 [Emiliania huxleyi CCMP1516]
MPVGAAGQRPAGGELGESGRPLRPSQQRGAVSDERAARVSAEQLKRAARTELADGKGSGPHVARRRRVQRRPAPARPQRVEALELAPSQQRRGSLRRAAGGVPRAECVAQSPPLPTHSQAKHARHSLEPHGLRPDSRFRWPAARSDVARSNVACSLVARDPVERPPRPGSFGVGGAVVIALRLPEVHCLGVLWHEPLRVAEPCGRRQAGERSNSAALCAA